MKGEDCKFPVSEDFPSFSHNGKHGPFLKHKKFVILAWLLLLVTMSITIGFTFRSAIEISELKEEIKSLKSSIKFLQQINQYYDYQEDPTLTDNDNYDDDFYDISYDDENDLYDGVDLESGTTLEKLLTGEEFTKDAKSTTPPTKFKRSIAGYTQDEIPISSDSHEEQRRKNITKKSITSPPTRSYSYPLYSQLRVRQDLDNYLTTPGPRRSKTMNQDNKPETMHKIGQLVKSGDIHNPMENPIVDFTVISDDQIGSSRIRHRQRRLELDDRRYGRMRPLPTAQFNGDTSKYVFGQHENYDGNGRLKHPQRTFVDWVESSWFHTFEMDRHFSFSDGILTVKESGLYFIYAQILYFDEHDTNGFRVYRNESETLLQCTTMTHSMRRVLKSNTCFTAGVEYLQENDRISLGDLSDSRYSLFEPGKSFFGVIKLGDVKILKRK